MRRQSAEVARGLLATVGVIGVLTAPPVALVRFVGNPFPGRLPSWQEVTDSIVRGGISDGTVIRILAVLAWVIWAQLAAAVMVEAVAVLRGTPSPKLPLLPGVQSLAAHWLAAATLVATPLGGGTSAEAIPIALTVTVDEAPAAIQMVSSEAQLTHVGFPAEQPEPPPAVERRLAEHVVERHDSLWDIAERHLGDPFRWQEIRDLNVGRVQPDGETLQPGFELIHPGWHLLVPSPSDVTGTAKTDHTARPGEHLWGIAEEAIERRSGRPASGDEVRPYWQRLIDENRDRLIDPADPNLIRSGQVFALPDLEAPPASPATVESEEAVEAAPEAEQRKPAVERPEASTTTRPSPSPSDPPVREHKAPVQDDVAPDTAAGVERGLVAPILGVAGAALSTAVLAIVRRRQRHRAVTAPHGHGPPPMPDEFNEMRTELAVRADEEGQSHLEAALCTVAAHVAKSPGLRGRRPVLVQVTAKRIEVLLDQPALPAPPGWQPQASGAVWACSRPVAPADVGVPSPALVTVGAEEGISFMLDLEALGLVTVDGDEEQVAALGRSILLELYHKASTDATALVVVGDLDVPDDEAVRRSACWQDVEQDVLAWGRQSRRVLEANRIPNVFAARGSGRPLDGLAPLVVLCDSLPASEGFHQVRDLASGGAAVAVVVFGAESADGTHLHLQDDQLTIHSLGLRCRPQGVAPGAAPAVQALVTAADRPAVPLVSFDEPEVIDLRADEYEDPPYDVLVKVLGEICVVGGNRGLTPKETALFTYVALHEGCSVDRLEEAIWPTRMESRRRQVHNIASQVRSALGSDHFPASVDSRYSVGRRVQRDIDLLSRRATYAASQTPARAIATLRGALELVESPPFGYRYADRWSYVWVDLEHWSAGTEAKVVEVAWRLWHLCHDDGDFDGAIWAARRGLSASPANSELTEALMRAYVAAGDRDAAEEVFVGHAKALERLDIDEPAPTTVDLWNAIRSGRDPEPNGALSGRRHLTNGRHINW